MPLLRLASLALVSLAIAMGCGSDVEAQACHDLPANGCPEDDGLACQDPSCAAAYVCNPGGVWSLAQKCPNYKPPPDASAGAVQKDAGGSVRDGGFPYPVPPGAYGGQGCVDLEPPDCPLGTVVSCSDPVDPCCGCDTLFVCQSSGWVTWGECEADGGIVASGN